MTELVNDNLTDVLDSSKSVVLIDFYAVWCGPCKMMEPVFEEVANELVDQISIIKVDVDANPNTAAAYGVRSIPTMIVLKDGVQVDMFLGAIPKARVVGLVDKHL